MGKSFFIPCFGKRQKKGSIKANGLYQKGTEPPLSNGNLKTELKSEKKSATNDYVTITNTKTTSNWMFTADWEKPEVIQLVVQYLPISTLKHCRLVCKSWNHEASRLLRLNENFCNTIPISQLREFTQTMSASSDNPMQSYQFHISSMRHPDLRYFFGQLGSTIVSLDVNLLITEVEAFFNILPWMPNLMELLLIIFSADNQPGTSSVERRGRDRQKPELIVRLVDDEIITYIENAKTLIYCNFELLICQKDNTSRQFCLTTKKTNLDTPMEVE